MNAEIMQLVEAKQLFLEEIKEFARTLSVDGEVTREELSRLLGKFYDEIVLSKELGSSRAALNFKGHIT